MSAYRWCNTCHKVYPARSVADGVCPAGHAGTMPVGRFGGMLKGFIAAGGLEERSEAQTRYRQLIHALWSQDERDQAFYQLLSPPLSMGKFVKRLDTLHLRGVDEGWIRVVLPASPFAPPSAYGIEYSDPERFIRELYALFAMPVPETAMGEMRDATEVGPARVHDV